MFQSNNNIAGEAGGLINLGKGPLNASISTETKRSVSSCLIESTKTDGKHRRSIGTRSRLKVRIHRRQYRAWEKGTAQPGHEDDIIPTFIVSSEEKSLGVIVSNDP